MIQFHHKCYQVLMVFYVKIEINSFRTQLTQFFFVYQKMKQRVVEQQQQPILMRFLKTWVTTFNWIFYCFVTYSSNFNKFDTNNSKETVRERVERFINSMLLTTCFVIIVTSVDHQTNWFMCLLLRSVVLERPLTLWWLRISLL